MEQKTPSLDQMTVVWKKSTDDFKNAELFPLPIINVVSDPKTETTVIICGNTGLEGKEIISKSRNWDIMKANPAKIYEILFYYVNPTSNTIMGFYVDEIGTNLMYAIDHAVYDFALSSLPVIKILIDKPIDVFEMA